MRTAKRLRTPEPNTPDSRLRTLTCCIIVDPMGGFNRTPEQEVEELKREFNEAFANPLRFYEAIYVGEGEYGIQPGTDIVLFDFGGMSLGNSLMQTNSRELIRWLQDNPNSLGIITSSFTWRNGIENELKELGFQTEAEWCWNNLTRDEGEQSQPLFHNVVDWCARYASERGEKAKLYTVIPDWFDAQLAGLDKEINSNIRAKAR